MPMALVIQSSEPTEEPKMPQGLVISESKIQSMQTIWPYL